MVRRIAWAGLILAAVIAAILIFRWPFTPERVTRSLGGATRCRVELKEFRQTFWPIPGAVAEAVTFSRGGRKLATVRRLTVEGSWGSLAALRRRVARLRAEGLFVRIPDPIPGAEPGGGGTPTVIGELIADGALIEIAPRVRMEIHRLTANEVASNREISFRVEMRFSPPSGELIATGKFGPWDGGRTPTSASYSFSGADLGEIPAIAGTLATRGGVNGTLRKLAVTGAGTVDAFRLQDRPHETPLGFSYRCTVDALRGAMEVNDAGVDLLNTALRARGSIDASGAALSIESKQARIEDLLRLFTRAPEPGLLGAFAFQTTAELPNDGRTFLRRLRMDGGFAITDARFARSQQKVNELSARARGNEDASEPGAALEPVASSLAGKVRVRDGGARFSALEFRVPGASAQGAGSYDLLTQRIDLEGKLALEARLSETQGGLKSLLLKPFNWVFRRRRAGTVLPVRVTGTYSQPKFDVQLRPPD